MIIKHWDKIYKNNFPCELSWFQKKNRLSIMLIKKYLSNKHKSIFDIGTGVSCLPKSLIEEGYKKVFFSDISIEALNHSKSQFSKRPKGYVWLQVDITKPSKLKPFSLWHDRAVFHFLRDEKDQLQYKKNLTNHLDKSGFVIISTFNMKGPDKCSGLKTVKYNKHTLLQVFGDEFEFIEEIKEIHFTPDSKKQNFSYFILKRSSK